MRTEEVTQGGYAEVGGWHVDIDSHTADDPWCVTIRNPWFYVDLRASGTDLVCGADFLDRYADQERQHVGSFCAELIVELFRNRADGKVQLFICKRDGNVVAIDLTDGDCRSLATAIRTAVANTTRTAE